MEHLAEQYGPIGLAIMYVTDILKGYLAGSKYEKFIGMLPIVLAIMYCMVSASVTGTTEDKVTQGVLMGIALAGIHRVTKVAVGKKTKK